MASLFLDTSAVVKLYHHEAGSDTVERLSEQPNTKLIVSRLSLIEIESALAIKVRSGYLPLEGQALARRRLRADLSQGRIPLGPAMGDSYFREARTLMERFGVQSGLRSLDALQLAVGLDLFRTRRISAIVDSDHRLCKVSEACGCPTIDPALPGPAILAMP